MFTASLTFPADALVPPILIELVIVPVPVFKLLRFIFPLRLDVVILARIPPPTTTPSLSAEYNLR
mgnify:CR=1 FL=1